MELRSAKYPSLDVLRAFAVLGVLYDHVFVAAIRTDRYAIGFGHLGVIMFFMHTSLVLHLSMERTCGEPAWIKRFYVRRLFRIYPLAMVAVAAAFFLRLPVFPQERLEFVAPTLKNVASNMLLLGNLTQIPPVLTVLWSLPFEVDMYVVLPFIFMFFTGRHWIKPAVESYAAAFLGLAVAYYGFHKTHIFAFLPCFLAGAVAFRAPRRLQLPWFLWPIGLLTVVMIVSSFQTYFDYIIFGDAAVALMLALTWQQFNDPPEGRFIKACEGIAKYSYGIYLTHNIALNLLRGLPPVYLIPGTLALTAILSFAAFHLIENPMIQVGKRIANSIGASRASE